MIYTTYFAKLKKLPSNIIPIAISASTPEGYIGLTYKALAPTWDILSNYKSNYDEQEYIRRYTEEILGKLNVHDEYTKLTQGHKLDVALVCYEKSGSFCHRNIVAKWFRDAGYQCEEWREDR